MNPVLLMSLFSKYGRVRVENVNADMIREIGGALGFTVPANFTDASEVVKYLKESDVNALADIASKPEHITKVAALVNPQTRQTTVPLVRECPYCQHAVYFEIDVPNLG